MKNYSCLLNSFDNRAFFMWFIRPPCLKNLPINILADFIKPCSLVVVLHVRSILQTLLSKTFYIKYYCGIWLPSYLKAKFVSFIVKFCLKSRTFYPNF